MPKVKCKYCGTSIDKSTAYKLKDRQYFCNEDHAKQFCGSDDFYKERLLERLCSLYTAPNYLALKSQLDRYIKENKYKYSGIEMTLDYYLNVLERDYNEEYGVGQFISYYQEAKEFFIKKNNIRKKLRAVSLDEPIKCVCTKQTANLCEKHREIIEDL